MLTSRHIVTHNADMMNAIDKAVAVCGSQGKLARRIGKKQPQVSYWVRQGRCSPEVCRSIEAATGGEVTVYELRPDVFGPPPDAAA